MFPTEDGIKHLTREELNALGVEEDLEMFDSVILVKDGGIMEMLMQIPADQVEAAKAEGAPVDENGYICVDSVTWKEEGGEFLYEENGEFVPAQLTEDGYLKFGAGMMLLEKVG